MGRKTKRTNWLVIVGDIIGAFFEGIVDIFLGILK
jgi:hypothetical protein